MTPDVAMEMPTPRPDPSSPKTARTMRLRTRILCGFGVIVAILAVVAASGYFAMERTASEFDRYRHSVEIAGDAASIEIDVARFRHHMEQFLRTGRREEAEAALREAEKLDADVDRGVAMAATPEETAQFKHLGEVVARLASDFDRLRMLEEERSALASGVLDQAGPRLAGELQDLTESLRRTGQTETATLAAAALTDALQARLHANLALVRQEKAEADAVGSAFGALKTRLAALRAAVPDPALVARVEQAMASAAAYETGVRDGLRLDGEIGVLLRDVISVEGAQIDEDAETLRNAAIAQERAIDAEVHATIANAETLALAMGAGGILLGLGLAWLIGNGIARPIVAMTAAMRRLADGDKSLEVPARDRGDEIGGMAAAVEIFRRNAIEMDRMTEAQRAEDARKAARQEAIETNIAGFQEKVGTILGTLASASTEMQHTAGTMSATAEETARQATAVAAASEEATVSVQTVASATEELAASVEEIGRQVDQSQRIAGDAVQQVEATHGTVQGLADAAERIGDVLKLISDIADQTNLLALNATIEAARAGEAGKGFAVVASEVKNLANQTARATEDISSQISGIQGATGNAVKAIQGIGGVISQVSEIASAIAGAVEEQSAATQEIAQNVQQAATGTSEVSANISGVSEAASDTGAASAQVLSTAGDLARQAETLRTEVDTFLESVRTA